jgi:hypothetical protein
MDTKRLGKFAQPGHNLTGDRRQRSRRVGWEYVHSIVDDCSRLAYSDIHDHERTATVTAFTERALDFFLAHGIVAERLMTDNALPTSTTTACASCSTAARSATSARRPTRPAPTARSSVYQQTLQREWAYVLEYASSTARRACWLRHYNERRTDSALGNLPPAHPRSGGHRAPTASLGGVSRFWLWTQVAIVVFVLAGAIIALTKI